MARKDNVYINLPKPLRKAADDYVDKHPELGYSGVPELVRDFLRDVITGKVPPPVKVVA